MYHAHMIETSPSHDAVADAAQNNWVDRFFPKIAKPFARLMRLDRPMPVWLLLLPCLWGLVLAQIASGGGMPNLWFAGLFLVGAVVMRGAGCTLNDIADKDFDAAVARTKSRPIPSGQVSVRAAWIFLAILLLIGLVILLQFNWPTVWLGVSSLAIVAVYPFMKRITYWPQVVLGLAFNWGALVGWSSVIGSVSAAPIVFYIGGIFWTLAYDTIYAHQDKEDDVLIGVKSTALKLGEATPKWLVVFFALAILGFGIAMGLAGAGIIAFIGLGLAALHAAWQIKNFRGDDPAQCLYLFKQNYIFGLIIFISLLIDCMVP
jgi:4-hydroxybenzoate polyprenyltransferase